MVNGRAITVAKYVTVYKQKGGSGATGQQNTKRFWTSNEEQPLKESLKAGQFFFSKTYGVIEVLQMCRKKAFVHFVDEFANINSIGVPYRRLEEGQVHFALPTYTMRSYIPLVNMFSQKVSNYLNVIF